ncbi:MAG: CDP-diacylglycerol--serine O-phosphatidyltransferase [Bacteroidota bacterium]|nr:CDP-diacylglycerol--serine O-phosphatidyltransferase [Bacteroidota bacterium]
MRIRLSRSIVPNLFTVLNIYFGLLSIMAASQEQFEPALWYIVLSAVCDSLDGLMARLTNSASEFGVELDSLADVVGFGVAPSFLLYALALSAHGTVGILVSAAPLIMGALRLARFNVQLVGFSKDHFTGMPIPLSALTIVSYILFFGVDAIQAQESLQYGLMATAAGCGALMISTIPYPVVPKISVRAFREQPVKMLLFTAAALIAIISAGTLAFPVLLVLIVSGPLFSMGRRVRHAAPRISRQGRTRARDKGEDEAEDSDAPLRDTNSNASIDSTI